MHNNHAHGGQQQHQSSGRSSSSGTSCTLEAAPGTTVGAGYPVMHEEERHNDISQANLPCEGAVEQQQQNIAAAAEQQRSSSSRRKYHARPRSPPAQQSR